MYQINKIGLEVPKFYSILKIDLERVVGLTGLFWQEFSPNISLKHILSFRAI